MRNMKALIRQLDEAQVPAGPMKARKVIPEVGAMVKAVDELAKAVRALEQKRKELSGVRPLMHWEVDMTRKDYEATPERQQARELFDAQAAVGDAHDRFSKVWNAWNI
jgi:prefoldin subunit 5